MRKFLALFMITYSTGQHDIVDIVCGISFSTTQGYRVFDMENVLFTTFQKLLEAVVASIVLQFEFLLYLLRSNIARS